MVSLIAQLMITFGAMRKRGEPSTFSMTAVPMILIHLGDQGSRLARSSTTRDTLGFDWMFR